MPMKLLNIPSGLRGVSNPHNYQALGFSYRSSLHFDHFRKIILVVNTITQNISKSPQCPFKRVRCPFFFGLLECCCFAFTIFDVAIANILRKKLVPQEK